MPVRICWDKYIVTYVSSINPLQPACFNTELASEWIRNLDFRQNIGYSYIHKRQLVPAFIDTETKYPRTRTTLKFH